MQTCIYKFLLTNHSYHHNTHIFSISPNLKANVFAADSKEEIAHPYSRDINWYSCC